VRASGEETHNKKGGACWGKASIGKRSGREWEKCREDHSGLRRGGDSVAHTNGGEKKKISGRRKPQAWLEEGKEYSSQGKGVSEGRLC